MGTAYVLKDRVHTIIININTKEASYIVNEVAGRQIATGTDEKGFESTESASNTYFQEEYRDNDKPITPVIDGKNYTEIDFGEHVGNIS